MPKNTIKSRLNEALSKTEQDEIKKEVTKQIKSSELQKVISSIVSKQLKNDKDLEDSVVEISKNVLTQLYKTLWVKRGFWKDTLKNQAS